MGLFDNDSREIRSHGKSRRSSGGRWFNGRLILIFMALIGINLYVFYGRSGTSIQDVLKSGSIARKNVPLPPKDALESDKTKKTIPSSSDDGSIKIKGSMKGQKGLLGALLANRVESSDAKSIISALEAKMNMRSLRPEHNFEVHLDPQSQAVKRFIFHQSAIARIMVTRKPDGSFKSETQEEQLTTKIVGVGGRIDSSLNQALSERGEKSALVATFVEMFSWDINWFVDPREGDEFKIVVEKKFLGDKFYSYGKVLAAEYRGVTGKYQAFYFQPSRSNAGYFSPEGRSIRRPFLKTPLTFRRISSHFNKKRFHPVLHTTRGHFGVDYAAPTGTPVWAAADGTVSKAAFSKGAGNMVVLNHASGITTLYMHLSKFAPGLKSGDKVKQKQLIGYVGSTGLSTGPHLHYGMLVKGRHVDPVGFRVEQGPMLEKFDRIKFLDTLSDKIASLEKIAIIKTAQAE